MVIKQQLTVLLSLFCSSHHSKAHNQSLLKDNLSKTDRPDHRLQILHIYMQEIQYGFRDYFNINMCADILFTYDI